MIPATSRQLSNSAHDRLWIESSTKVAGRKIVVSISTPGRPGFISLQRLLHPTGDGERVAPGELFDDEHEAWAVVDDGIADHALRRIDKIGHVAQQQRRLPGRVGHRHLGQRLRCNAGADEAKLKALIGCFDEAAGTDMRAAGIAQQANVEGIGNRLLHLVERDIRGWPSASGQP